MNKFLKTLSAMTIASFAATFTACGEDNTAGVTEEAAGLAMNSSDSEDDELSSSSKKAENSSSSKKDEKSSSSEKVKSSSSSEKDEPVKFSGKISGVSQKGPFLVGSTVTLHELDGTSFDLSGRSFVNKIKNDKGEFEVSFKDLSSNYALFIADGYYRNEVNGKKSTSPIKLNALSDLTDRNTVNVNLLTHLEFDRVKYLTMSKDVEYSKAKAQAEKEIFDAFGISFKEGASAEDLNIVGSTENDGALLALSVLMQGTSAEGAFSERLSLVAQDLVEDGTIDDKQILADIADEVALMDLAKVRKNVEGWKLSTTVPDFENFVETYWTTNYGIGDCTADDISKAAKNTNKLSKNYEKMYVCEETGWREMSADEAKYGTCAANEDGKRFEKSRICDGGKWRSLTADESMGACTEEKIGETVVEENELSVNFEKKHVCGGSSWHVVSALEEKLGYCTSANAHKGLSDNDQLYACDGEKWIATDKFNYDAYTLVCEKDGELVYSELNEIYYVCKDGKLLLPNFDDFSISKKFTANLWNGAEDPKFKVGEIENEIFLHVSSDFSGFGNLYNSKNEKLVESNDEKWRYYLNDENGVSRILEDKGLKYSYTSDEYHNTRPYFISASFVSMEKTDVSDWNGACIVYASSVPLIVGIGETSGDNQSTNYKLIPASTELTVANIEWKDFSEQSNGGAYDDITKNFTDLYIYVENPGTSKTYIPSKGSVYIAGVGKYNGCSVK